MHAEPPPPSGRQCTAPSNPSSSREQTSHAGSYSSACLPLAEHCSCMCRNQPVSDKAKAAVLFSECAGASIFALQALQAT